MKIEQFIEKAIAGGYMENTINFHDNNLLMKEDEKKSEREKRKISAHTTCTNMMKEQLLLDPLAWQAVGKVEGWKERCMDCGGEVTRKETPEYPNIPNGLSWCDARCPRKMFVEGWHEKMHRMIDALADGKSLEDFISTL